MTRRLFGVTSRGIWSHLRGQGHPQPSADLVERRNVRSEQLPAQHGVELFDTSEAIAINKARLAHLASLDLALAGTRVLDVGAGPGHLAQFFVARGCDVVSADARAENIVRMHELYPEHVGYVEDVEVADFSKYGRFDVVFCYGLLYHLENPIGALRAMSAVCDRLLLLETVVVDSTRAILRLEDEYLSANQALRGLAHRPSPAWVALALNRIGFAHVYAVREPPNHPDYRYKPQNDLSTERDGHLLRAIYVASRELIANERLVPMLRESA